MPETKVRLRKEEIVIIGILTTLLLSEFLTLMLLIYFARSAIFISLFITTIRLISPVFLAVNAMFLISNIFVKGKELIVKPWAYHLWEMFKFSMVSFLITLALITISAFIGTLLIFLLKWISRVPKIDSMVGAIKEWVEYTFY